MRVWAMKKALSLILVVGLALAGVPAGAEVFGPNTVWGVAPQAAASAANAVLRDATGKTVAMVPVVDGKFAFRDLPAGQYVVALQTATGEELARSLAVNLDSGGEVEALFGRDTAAAAVPPGSTAPVVEASTGGGLGTTAWILIGAAAVGITTVVLVATNEDEGAASPSR
jgi:hypothetical protein